MFKILNTLLYTCTGHGNDSKHVHCTQNNAFVNLYFQLHFNLCTFPEKMDIGELKLLLKSSETRNVTKALLQIRTKEVKSQSGLQHLLDQNLVSYLIPILDRSNQKNIDISLSILGNLLQTGLAQTQIRQCSGLNKLVNILDNIQDRNILCRAWRALANACQDRDNLSELRSNFNLSSIISRAFSSLSGVGINDGSTDILTVLVRCVRICCPPDVLSQEPIITETLVSLIRDHVDTEKSLLKTTCKCVAKLSHGAAAFHLHSLMPAADSLVSIVRNSNKPELADNCLGTLVNLSQHDQFRPGLGSAGVVELLVEQYRAAVDRVGGVPRDTVVRTLCLYCRESVNRVRMREGGGCGVLVSVLASQHPIEVRDTVLRSLLQFLYDNHSLNVLMSEGLVPCLVTMIQTYMDQDQVKHDCSNTDTEASCSEVGETSESDDKVDKVEDSIKPNDSVNVGFELNLSDNDDDENCDEKSVNEDENSRASVDNIIPQTSSTTPSTVSSSSTGGTKATPVFRITSPSYQAVQYELEQFMLMKSTYTQQQQLGTGSPLSWSLSSPGPSSPPPCSLPPDPESPGSSLCQSPDRSPPPINCSYSPASSPARSLYSPLMYSPSCDRSEFSPNPTPSYSPVENFSDDEEAEDKKDENEENPVEDKVANESSSERKPDEDVPTSSDSKCDKSRESEQNVMSLNPWTKRSIKIQRTTTFLGQTFVLPPTTRERSPACDEGPSKRPRLSSSLSGPPYKYISSLSVSPKKPVLTRQSSKASVSSEVEVDTNNRVTWILQILSRLSQADRPHSDLTSVRTVDTLLIFLSQLPNNDVVSSKAAKILTRLSTNLHCLFPFLLSRHISRLMLKLEQLELSCDGCGYSQLSKFVSSVSENITLLAETGYGEGEICHRLVHPLIGKQDKQSIVISAALLVRQRRMLHNILIRHDTLDMLLDTLETEDVDMVRDCVHSVSKVSAYLGVAVCCDRSVELEPRSPVCRRYEGGVADDLILLCDDGSEISCNKSVLCEASNVFAAMLSGSFTESEQTRVPLPHTSVQALTCLVHNFYTCDPDTCPEFVNLSADTLLELVTLSDKYLLTELNLSTCHAIIRHAGSPRHLSQIYKSALQTNYPVNCAGR